MRGKGKGKKSAASILRSPTPSASPPMSPSLTPASSPRRPVTPPAGPSRLVTMTTAIPSTSNQANDTERAASTNDQNDSTPDDQITILKAKLGNLANDALQGNSSSDTLTNTLVAYNIACIAAENESPSKKRFFSAKDQSDSQMKSYIREKRVLDMLREQELHKKKLKLVELQIEAQKKRNDSQVTVSDTSNRPSSRTEPQPSEGTPPTNTEALDDFLASNLNL